MLLLVLDALLLLFALKLVRVFTKPKGRTFPLPPGPKGWPIIGNYLDLRGGHEWKVSKRWGDLYGDIVYVKSLGHEFIVLNSLRAVVDLFEKRGQIYSERPYIPLIELENLDWVTTMLPYGDKLKRERQFLHSHMQKSVVGNFCPQQTRSTYRILYKLLDKDSGNNFVSIFKDAFGEAILLTAYGHQVQDNDDPYVRVAENGLYAFFAAISFSVVNMVPALRFLPSWLPGIPFLRVAREGKKASLEMWQIPHELAKQSLKDGSAMTSIWSQLMEKMDREGSIENEQSIAQIVSFMYAASIDTILSAVSTFVLAMLLHPEVQRTVQEELDRVLGKDVLPTLEDRPNLPYMEAVLKESLRWEIVGSWGVPHATDRDDYYKGYFIPKGIQIFPNLWAMTQDEREYPQPQKFMPERWMVPEESQPLDPHKYVFGIGRRFFADNSLFLAFSNILACYNIEKAVGDDGELITPPVEYGSLLVRHPKPFRCRFIPRHSTTEGLVRSVYHSSR